MAPARPVEHGSEPLEKLFLAVCRVNAFRRSGALCRVRGAG